MACKNKWWPHNWFCLKSLYWIFVALFYFVLIYMVYVIVVMTRSPLLMGLAYWQNVLWMLFTGLGYMLSLITIATILKTLYKIKHAVAPCCCEAKKEEVVVVASEEK